MTISPVKGEQTRNKRICNILYIQLLQTGGLKRATTANASVSLALIMICPTSALLPAAICQAVYVTRQTWGGPRLEL